MASSNPGYDEKEVLVQEPNASARILTLNSPRRLNVISIKMVSQLTELFLAYDNDANVKLVIDKGNGRAFCAGGDVVTSARHLFNGNWRYGAKLTYILCYVIATNSKPQVSILDGIVMGGGAGVSIPGRFRVATENTMFAMPEVIIGSFPDVGSSYFLSRLPGFFGEYLGLTGSRLDGPELLALGLATHFVPSTKLALLEEALVSKVSSSASSTCDAAFISAIIDEYSQRPAPKETSACRKMLCTKEVEFRRMGSWADMKGFTLQVLTGRWLMLFSSFLMMASAGTSYMFGLYSNDIKSSIGYSQTTLNLISFFKDLGILSGLINEVTSPWVVLSIGAAFNFFGYFMIWLAVTKKIARPQVWHMCMYITIGANSHTFINTGALVTWVKNFPSSRGLLLGLLNGYIGLSAAVIAQLYHALYGDDTKSFTLFVACMASFYSFFDISPFH